MGLAERVPDDGSQLLPAEAVSAEPAAPDDSGIADLSAPPGGRAGLWRFLVGTVGTLLVIWFFIAWLALERPAADAAGESVGSAFALLLVASAIGAFRGRER